MMSSALLGYYIGILLLLILNIWSLLGTRTKSQHRVIAMGNLFAGALIANWFVSTRK